MAEAQRKAPDDVHGTKILEDRVGADAELVGQVLDPGRTPDVVAYPDPKAPNVLDDTPGADSVAEMQMARRTDAGARQPAADTYRSGGALVWVGAIAALAIVLLALAVI
jgi:hypothetical protein